jgi:lysyl-tRNA synthetase class 2
MLAPRLHVIPEQITDGQTLARFPQLDLMMHSRKRDLLRIRAQIERVIQDFFNQRGFVKVSTPILAASTGGANAQPFVTSAHRLDHQSLTLRISQELDLKKLVVAGMDRVYEIGPNFRNEGMRCRQCCDFLR